MGIHLGDGPLTAQVRAILEEGKVLIKAKLIHILSAGKVLCGRSGAPVTWEPGESWVGPADAHQATCPGCIETTGFSIAALKKQGRRRK